MDCPFCFVFDDGVVVDELRCEDWGEHEVWVAVEEGSGIILVGVVEKCFQIVET